MGPGAPVITGETQTEPAPIVPEPPETGEPEIGEPQPGPDLSYAEIGAYTPPHMQGRDLIRLGVVLPFSHPREAVRQEAEGMLAGIELALFDQGRDNIVLLPANSGGSQSQTAEVSARLLERGADIILGPLFGPGVPAAQAVMNAAGKPIIAFTNDTSRAGNGAWLASISPEEEVDAIVEYAALRGYQQFAFFGPQNGLGQRVEQAMQSAAERAGGYVIASGFYPATSANPDMEAESFARTIEGAASAGGKVAVLIPERGNRLRRIAPLLAYYGVDTRVVKILGTLAWNDPDIWREPSLRGAWFPAAPARELDDFRMRYERQYGVTPSSLAGLAYDAAALSIALSADGALEMPELLSRDGFMGVNGLFRFRSNGTTERSLAIMEIDPGSETGAEEILPVSPSFDPTIG